MNEYGITVLNGNEIASMLEGLDKDIRESALNAAASKAAKPIVDQVRKEIKPIIKSSDGMSKASYIKRNVVAERPQKRFGIGVNVKVKGADIPVGDRFWKIYGYAVLLGEGSYKAKGGKRRTRKNKADRGYFKGFGNFIQKGWNKVSYMVEQIYISEIDMEVQRAFERSNKRLTKKTNG